MSIYQKKQSWKIWLVAVALLIVVVSLWYTNILANKIALEERTKVKLWAEAIQKKANLVKYTNSLFDRLKTEERKKVELWAEGSKKLANPNLDLGDLSFIFEVIKNNESVPVILADENNKVISSRNLDSAKANDETYLAEQIKLMSSLQAPIEIVLSGNKKNYLYYKDSKLFSELKLVLDDLIKSFISEVVINSASVPVLYTDQKKEHIIYYGNIDSSQISSPEAVKLLISNMAAANTPLAVELGNGEKNYIFYKDSFLLTQLKYYPFVQFGIIGLFMIIAYTLFSTARKAEQNQVWVGMAKETAHQLGTPLSSLIAWIELLKARGLSEESVEIEKDVHRLETITERFSKIGSQPVLKKENLIDTLQESMNYMQTRTSKKVAFSLSGSKDIYAPISVPLFEWVIENLLRNAVDAMEGSGAVTISVSDQTQFAYIDIADTGKGIPKSQYKTIFEPGFTTKKRGWGLGLSLTKRIIENYHNGKIFVKNSELEKGTTFRIVLRK
jgi:two-component system, sporulation sensor kinase D